MGSRMASTSAPPVLWAASSSACKTVVRHVQVATHWIIFHASYWLVRSKPKPTCKKRTALTALRSFLTWRRWLRPR